MLYLDDKDTLVMVAPTLDRDTWGAYRINEDTGAQQRVPSPKLVLTKSEHVAIESLDAYAAAKKWTELPGELTLDWGIVRLRLANINGPRIMQSSNGGWHVKQKFDSRVDCARAWACYYRFTRGASPAATEEARPEICAPGTASVALPVVAAPALPAISPEHLRDAAKGTMLQQLTAQIQRDIAELRAVDNQTAYIGLRVGVCLVIAKDYIRFGKFEDWKLATFSYEKSQLRRFQALGMVFFKERRKTLAVATGAREAMPQPQLDPHTGALQMPEEITSFAAQFVGEKSLADLLDDYGIKRRERDPEDEPLCGGNAPLLAWLREHHPDCKARALLDLPEEIRKEFDAWQASLSAEFEAAATAAQRRLWHKHLAKLHESVRRRQYDALSRSELEHSAALLADMRSAVMEVLKR